MALIVSTSGDTAFTNIADLRSAIAAWLDRDDLTERVDEFIGLAETYIFRAIGTLEQETTADVTITDGSGALPADFQGIRRVTVGGVTLDGISPQAAAANIWTGDPRYWYIAANRLSIVPTGATTCQIVYQARYPRLSDSNPTNGILTSHPDAYLFGSLAMAEAYLANDSRVPLWLQAFNTAIDGIEMEARRKKHSGGPLRPVIFGATP